MVRWKCSEREVSSFDWMNCVAHQNGINRMITSVVYGFSINVEFGTNCIRKLMFLAPPLDGLTHNILIEIASHYNLVTIISPLIYTSF